MVFTFQLLQMLVAIQEDGLGSATELLEINPCPGITQDVGNLLASSAISGEVSLRRDGTREVRQPRISDDELEES
ncbi:F-box/LRR-repeat protein [Marssonina coronariae]|uniref:F-box/LRR-repeat protein n=1 Tax=Diplocarpon coronariae TaxID=2795749 RepID=A0A218ZDR0_9HELO|nr:F-box/LRR-repeat protein [Marssonina coronariae]